MLSQPDSSGTMTSVTTMKGINDQILCMDYHNFKVQIFHANAQVSCNGRVIVLVTGCLIGKENLRRKFTQSFFLAPQEKGYFVLNDVFRYVDEKEESMGSVPTQVADHHVSNHKSMVEKDTNSCKETSHLLDNGMILNSSVKSIRTDALPVKQTAASKTQEEAPKKSYASVVHDLNKSKSPFNVITRSPPAKPVHQLRTTAAVAPEASAPSGNITVERNNDLAIKGHSIFIGNLPEIATVLPLKEIFEQFGEIKPDGIQVRSQKQRGNCCFGFVEFESAGAVQSVFQAAPIMMGGRRASIEEKRGNSVGGRFTPNQGGYRDK
ncbi:hypothetical protein EZV62_018381 [Acer yangbiense]|uniref:RRM domain-containing protein n=1 Tax=Acer yangbiense TaxID=1000413 RepID=A0A5C7HJL6_9ROSI|nr:hypothetical protein EZV62_018381 [Acer yangbiense]